MTLRDLLCVMTSKTHVTVRVRGSYYLIMDAPRYVAEVELKRFLKREVVKINSESNLINVEVE